MKYWGYLVAKLALAAGTFVLVSRVAGRAAKPMWAGDPMGDFRRTLTMLVFWLIASGIVWLIVWDQRYRCRTCLRRLRMPILRGSWTHVLLGAPHTEYICPYGHGTLSVAELQITGRTEPDWEAHQDMWKELISLEETKK